MKKPDSNGLSRRERQIMDVIYALGEATAADIRARIADPPSYSAVRTLLRVLEAKGHVRHREQGPRYVYGPTVARERARKSALKHLMQTFFEGSPESLVATLMDIEGDQLSEGDMARLQNLIERARKGGRQ